MENAVKTKQYMAGKLVIICTFAFLLAAILIALSDIFHVPTLMTKILPLSPEGLHIAVNTLYILIVAAVAIHLVSRLGLERTKAEEALQAEKNKLQSVIDAMEDGLTIQDKDYNIIYQNELVRKIFGDHLGEKCYRVYESKEKMCNGCPVEKAFKDGKSHTAERRVVIPSGEVTFWENTANPIRDAVGRIVSCLEINRNITERKRAEQALADEATWRRILVNQSRDGIVILDQNGKVYETNQKFAEMLGYSPEEVTQLHVWDWDTQWTREQLLGMIQSVDETGDHFQTYHRRKDGTVYDVEISTNGAVYGGQKLVFCVCRDITERKQAEQALKQSQEKLGAMFESVTDGISVIDLNGVITEVNQRAVEMHGYDSKNELLRRSAFELVAPRDRGRIANNMRKAIKQGTISGVEYTLLKADGSEFPGELSTSVLKDASGNMVGHITIARDITERRRAEKERRELEARAHLTSRLASIGEMAAGIAHEINNPLTAVIGFAQLLMDTSIPDDVKKDIAVIYKEAQRAAEVAKNLLVFARKREPARQPTDINHTIDEVLKLRAYEQKVNNIQVNTRFAPELPTVMADYSQLQQVFLNIIINAETAMLEAHNGGKLTITTRKVNNTIRISFTDNGPGIAKENLERVFDPFFTTKEVGKGTGLGLSLCHGIVVQHGGRIYARSKLGTGATFVVELPINAQ